MRLQVALDEVGIGSCTVCATVSGIVGGCGLCCGMVRREWREVSRSGLGPGADARAPGAQELENGENAFAVGLWLSPSRLSLAEVWLIAQSLRVGLSREGTRSEYPDCQLGGHAKLQACMPTTQTHGL